MEQTLLGVEVVIMEVVMIVDFGVEIRVLIRLLHRHRRLLRGLQVGPSLPRLDLLLLMLLLLLQ
jgi:hypothetical protein